MAKNIAIAYSMKKKGKGPKEKPSQEKESKPELPEKGEGVGSLLEVTCPHCEKSFSHGGQVANDTDMSADMKPNEFDELVLSGGLEADDDHDVVKRAMKKKYK